MSHDIDWGLVLLAVGLPIFLGFVVHWLVGIVVFFIISFIYQ